MNLIEFVKMDFKTEEQIRRQIDQVKELWEKEKYEEAKLIEQIIKNQLAQFADNNPKRKYYQELYSLIYQHQQEDQKLETLKRKGFSKKLEEIEFLISLEKKLKDEIRNYWKKKEWHQIRTIQKILTQSYQRVEQDYKYNTESRAILKILQRRQFNP